ncbi:MAG: ABC transporter substrate-binding protein [Rhodospirillaceae bacterium]|nr:ABC transporter substrate-binding protein [Rhodospirillaceae bacterium]
MRKWPFLLAGLAAVVLSAVGARAAGGPPSPGVQVADGVQQAAQAPVVVLHDALIAAMKAGKSTPFADRERRLEPVIARAFDLPAVTETAAGPYWSRMSEQERKSLIDAFAAYSVAKYAANFDSFSGQRFEIVGQKPGPGDSVWVLARFVSGGEKPINFNYLVKPSQDGWRIVDVYTAGSISEVSTQRSQFMSILRDRGVPGLLKALAERTGKLEHDA